MEPLSVADVQELLQFYEEKRDVVTAVDAFLEKHPDYAPRRHSLSGYLTWYRRRASRVQASNHKIIAHDFQFVHNTLVRSAKESLEKEGFRTVIIGNGQGRIPDIVALKGGLLYQVEVQRTKDHPVEGKIDSQYDATIFFSGDLEPRLYRHLIEPEPEAGSPRSPG